MKVTTFLLLISFFAFNSCAQQVSSVQPENRHIQQLVNDSIIDPGKIIVKKDFLYDQHTLADTFAYKNTTRVFQWDRIRARLALLDKMQAEKNVTWAIVQNNKNKNGQAPLVKVYRNDEYNQVIDTFGTARYQSVPLYLPTDSITPELYGKDGSLVKVVTSGDKFIKIATLRFGGEWLVPKKYIKIIGDSVKFTKAIFIDRTNQNIAVMENIDSLWLVRSMNPATTGLHQPPFKQPTPTGIFVLQEKRKRMDYYKDGTTEMGGFSPWANRFSGGAYIHGVPIDLPRTETVEFSSTLGTTPRSHMCVRNATSHALWLFEWAPVNETIIFVFD